MTGFASLSHRAQVRRLAGLAGAALAEHVFQEWAAAEVRDTLPAVRAFAERSRRA